MEFKGFTIVSVKGTGEIKDEHIHYSWHSGVSVGTVIEFFVDESEAAARKQELDLELNALIATGTEYTNPGDHNEIREATLIVSSDLG